MERIADVLETATEDSPVSAEKGELISALSSGLSFSRQDRMELEADALARYFRLRQQLLQGSLSAPEVAKLLGTSRQTPHDRVKAGTLLAIKERGGLQFPTWQFDPDGPDGVLEGLPSVLRALNVSPIEKLSWFMRPHAALNARTPLQALQNGEITELTSIARTVGVN